ncbi:MAG TPA: Fur family transcriptional regulator [Sedimentisphaerales bacterium]|nr:transcriptional repressor [Phycisphaerae bacterium]HON92854.1 Fur family transcriptional regulator [Sedimentisphaerales bacterium]HOV77977.1 Fur family transcriptional regulator [Sedimentisphaerales bacterium]HQI27718.1 Fur family transcriptional regulator [Sedimentisphaerales bacterium]
MKGKRQPCDRQETEKRLAEFQSRCRQAGLKVTPQRMAVYKALVETTEHPSAEAVFRKVRRTFPSISLDTVNRTLLTLSEMGAAFVVEGSGDAKRFDANLCTHQHFKCLKCRRILDFHHEPFDRIDVPANLLGQVTVLRKTVYLEGLCNHCNKES